MSHLYRAYDPWVPDHNPFVHCKKILVGMATTAVIFFLVFCTNWVPPMFEVYGYSSGKPPNFVLPNNTILLAKAGFSEICWGLEPVVSLPALRSLFIFAWFVTNHSCTPIHYGSSREEGIFVNLVDSITIHEHIPQESTTFIELGCRRQLKPLLRDHGLLFIIFTGVLNDPQAGFRLCQCSWEVVWYIFCTSLSEIRSRLKRSISK